MKNKILIPAIIVVILGVFFSFKYAGTNTVPGSQEEKKTILQTVMALINQGHYSPRDIDDDFSKAVFGKTIENLDYDKKFFFKSDYERLKSEYELSIDDEIRSNSLDFFEDINELFVERISGARKYYQEILQEPFSLDENDSLQLDGKKLEFVDSEEEMRDRWHANLKYRVLVKYIDLKEAEDKKLKDSTDYQVRDHATLEEEARESIAKIQERYFKRLEKLNDNDRFSLFMNSITSTEDPHTGYLPPADKKRFDEMMSGSFIGIGASLQQHEDGKIKINAIITGSPSWKQGKLKAEDEILRVAQGEEQPVDVEGMDLEDVVKMIRGKEGTEVQLTVKHADGTNEVIAITRGKVELEDVFAKSAIIENEGKKLGYIYLPEFYADFNGLTGRRSGKDVEKEVVKLKEENVDGIILDLRNNGGGSLSDVVDMAGIFIGKGPVVQVLSSGNQSITLRSKAAAPIYTGPLAIMVNGSSASASEILAAAMQDYGRATIVGSKTFGKGTVQKLVPLDQFVNSSVRNQIMEAFNKAKGGEAEYDGIGSLKLTIQKFYRINGGSTQLEGVTPDINLPSAYDKLDFGERRDEHALPFDKIPAVTYNNWKANPPLDFLINKSKERIANNEIFEIINQTGDRLKKQQDHNVVPLNKTKFVERKEESKALSAKIDAIDSLGTPLIAKNLAIDIERVNVDSAATAKNKDWLKNLKKDAYIYETSNILKDWISHK